MSNRYFARKTGITRTYAVTDSTTGRNVTTTGTYASADRKAVELNKKDAS